ncbi:SusC/RagA family TonB-linked outer membrane protein [Gelidibacter salicanalis]|uniref:SusC/RagA family TonB-linked outer membrane protein n=1 Tax=Gelidibacter salicanalis TaxID=291193 RepID=A0A934KPB6_9FLAO|nr:SusC/RagA family TonB-linked outer membrane protein [Gelidibacter salicanalis]MBJ7883011.1 SusC/RagA family TonB-linked outer membrane protein [Gelidibacter salicanalis]
MKKNKTGSLPLRIFSKIDLKMKLTALLLIVSLFQTQANSRFNDDRLSLDIEEASLLKVFEKIESISDYRFLFESKKSVFEKKITLKLKNKEIKEVLDVILSGTDIEYRVKGRQIILLRDEKNHNSLKSQSSDSNKSYENMDVQHQVKGIVSDGQGIPMIGTNIIEKGTTNGTQTDFDGAYSLIIPSDGILVVSYVGYKTKEVPVGNQTTINITLEEDSARLEEVVVTALGISREKKSLGYATQEVSGDDVNRVPTDNVVNALSGKVSGVQIKNNSNLGGSSNVIIRGSTSLTGDNQALFVVDGVPISNSNFNTSDQQNGGGGFDYGNLASDINPEDIASINVLKGAAATALYGSRATNGAVIITTKSGAGAKDKPRITLNTGVTMGFIDKSTWPKFQYEYGTGYGALYGPNGNEYFNQRDVNNDGILDLVSPSTAYGSYGGEFNSNLLVYQWDSFYPESPNYLKPTPWEAPQDKLISFFETPVTLVNSISLSGGAEKANYRISYTNFEQDGIMPNSNISRNNISVNTGFDLSDKLKTSASANYIKTDALGRNRTGNESAFGNGGNVVSAMRKYWPMNVGIKELKEAYFSTGRNIDPYMGGTIDNPYWVLYENYQNDTRSRIFGNASLNYKIANWLNVEGRVSLDTYSFLQEERANQGTRGREGKYERKNINFSEMNYDLMLNFNKHVFEKLNISGVLGLNIRRNDFSSISAVTNGGLVIPGLYSHSNSVNIPNANIETKEKIGVDGFYGLVSFGYDNLLYVDVTGRFDHSSTLPKENSTYFYPSISTSFIFSNLIDSDLLSFGKLRLNYAEVGSSAPANSLTDVLSKPTPFGAIPLYGVNTTKNNTELLPESTVSTELGVELRLLKSRLRIDMSIYKTNSKDQIIPVAISTTTGYSSKFVNAGEIENKGIELALSGSVIKTDDFTWDINVNWARNKSKVISLFEGASNLQLGSVSGVTINATIGQPYGTIQGTDYIYLDGKRVINQTNGEYLRTTTSNNVIGNVTPEWNGGITNSLRYKNFNFSFLIDMQTGGDVYSRDIAVGNRSGLYDYSVGLNDLGNPMRNSLANGGGILLEGVSPEGQTNTVRTAMDTYNNATGSVKAPAAHFIYDASYVKLREVSLTYSFPKVGLLDKIKVESIKLSLVGSNLWIIHKNLPFSDPETNLSSGNIQGFQEGVLPSTRNLGLNLQLQL